MSQETVYTLYNYCLKAFHKPAVYDPSAIQLHEDIHQTFATEFGVDVSIWRIIIFRTGHQILILQIVMNMKIFVYIRKLLFFSNHCCTSKRNWNTSEKNCRRWRSNHSIETIVYILKLLIIFFFFYFNRNENLTKNLATLNSRITENQTSNIQGNEDLNKKATLVKKKFMNIIKEASDKIIDFVDYTRDKFSSNNVQDDDDEIDDMEGVWYIYYIILLYCLFICYYLFCFLMFI